MHRVPTHAFMILLLAGAWLLLLAVAVALGLTHYTGLSEGLALLKLDTEPLAQVPLAGPIFMGIAPDANFSNFLALAGSFLILAGSWFVCNVALRLVELLANRAEHLQNGQAAAFRRTLVRDCTLLAVTLVPLVWVIRMDAGLFTFRSLMAITGTHFGDAVTSVPGYGALAADKYSLASVQLLGDALFWGYIGISISAPVLLDVIGGKIGERWAMIQAAFAGDPAPEEAAWTLYGYDAQGEPVYDPDTPIAYDADQNPVDAPGAGEPANDPLPPSAAGEWAQEAASAPEPAPAAAPQTPEPALYDVQGRPGTQVTLAEARANRRDYHIVKGAPPTVYWLPYWEALHASTPKEAA